MDMTSVTILGAGSLRCGPAIIGSLGSYYGERPLDVRFYDPDAERLDLFDQLARVTFDDTSVEHQLRTYGDHEEALADAERVVLALDLASARLLQAESDQGDDVEVQRAAIAQLVANLPREILVLSLLPAEISVPYEMYYRLDWPGPLLPGNEFALKFQILRWLHREEPIYGLVDPYERSPLKQWLDDPTTAEPIVGARNWI